MALDNESFNKQLYDLLKVRGYNPVPKNSKNQDVDASQLADVIEFQFVKDGEKYGKAWASIDDAKNVIIYYDEAQADSPEGNTPGLDYDDSWSGFLKHVKTWAQRKQLSFELLNKDRLNDAMKQREYVKMKENLREGYYSMGKQASYSDAVPTVKIILQHTRQIQEGEQRYRNIAKIFLENTEGERILAPTTRPGIAQVYARHLAEGGVPNDNRWNHIKSLCEEYQKMSGFVRATRNGQFNESAQQLVNEGINHYHKLRESLGKLRGHRGYNMYFESWTPALMEDESEENNLNELFVQETMDPRIESAMPILSRLRKHVGEMSEVKSLSGWADDIINEKLDLQLEGEEVEQIDELSTERLLAYRKKAQDHNDNMVRRQTGEYSIFDRTDQRWEGERRADAKIKKKTGSSDPSILDRVKAKLRNDEAKQIDEAGAKEKDVAKNVSKTRAERDYQASKLEPDAHKYGSFAQGNQEVTKKLHSKAEKEYGKALGDIKKTPVSKFIKGRKGDGKVHTNESVKQLVEYEKFTDENGVTWNDEGDSDKGHTNWGRGQGRYVKKAGDKFTDKSGRRWVRYAKADGSLGVRPLKEAEQIDEIGDTAQGQETLKSYKEKAKKDMANAGEKLWYLSVTKGPTKDKWALAVQRDKHRKGLKRADARIKDKEEVEQVDEISTGKKMAVAYRAGKRYVDARNMDSYFDKIGANNLRDADVTDKQKQIDTIRRSGTLGKLASVAGAVKQTYMKEEDGKEGLLFAVFVSHPKKTDGEQERKLIRITGTDDMRAGGAHAQNHFTQQGYKVHKVQQIQESKKIDEISRDLAVNYSKKAADDMSDREYGVLGGRPDKERKLANREKGRDLAMKKLGWGNAKVPVTHSDSFESRLNEISDTPLLDMEDYLEKKKELQYLLKHPEASNPEFKKQIQSRLGRLEQQKAQLASGGHEAYSMNEGMGEADMIVQDLISGEQDAYSILSNPTSQEEKYVSQLLQKEFDEVVIDTGLHPDDDLEEILNLAVEQLAKKYKHGEIDDSEVQPDFDPIADRNANERYGFKELDEVDMGQADRTLRSNPSGDDGKMAHTMAMRKAANQMGYDHYMDVPDSEIEQLHALAKKIRNGEVSEGILDMFKKKKKSDPLPTSPESINVGGTLVELYVEPGSSYIGYSWNDSKGKEHYEEANITDEFGPKNRQELVDIIRGEINYVEKRFNKKQNEVDEDLDANQKRAGQLGPTEKIGPKGAVGKLVGANESVEHDPLNDIKRLLGK